MARDGVGELFQISCAEGKVIGFNLARSARIAFIVQVEGSFIIFPMHPLPLYDALYYCLGIRTVCGWTSYCISVTVL